jgi:hypothetical protein
MKTTLAILAVTAMKTGVCIAGVRPEAPSVWVRPRREFGSVVLGDITYPAHAAPGGSSPSAPRRVMRPFDLVELSLGKARPDPPHVEDFTCDFVHVRPRFLGTVPEEKHAALLDGAACTPEAVWREHTRSLGTLAIAALSATFAHDTYTGKYEARVAFPGLPPGVSSAPVTDLKWRALGRRLLASGEHASDDGGVRTLTLDEDGVRDVLGGGRDRASAGRDYWIVMGVSRAYNGQLWPLIVGIHTLPDYEADVDYSAL